MKFRFVCFCTVWYSKHCTAKETPFICTSKRVCVCVHPENDLSIRIFTNTLNVSHVILISKSLLVFVTFICCCRFVIGFLSLLLWQHNNIKWKCDGCWAFLFISFAHSFCSRFCFCHKQNKTFSTIFLLPVICFYFFHPPIFIAFFLEIKLAKLNSNRSESIRSTLYFIYLYTLMKSHWHGMALANGIELNGE